MVQVKRVLIIGGGIGGLSTAIALRKHGVGVEIVEAAPEWNVYGVGIIQPSNALRALDRLGLAELCIAKGGGFKGWDLCDSQGAHLTHVPSRNVAREGFPPINGITRPVLHTILSETAYAVDTNIRLGTTVTSMSESAGQVDVEFTDGTRSSYDLIVGADGAYSRTRTMLFGDRVKPVPTGQSVWRHNFKRPKDLNCGALYFGKKSKAGLVLLSDELMYLFLVTPERTDVRMPEDRLHEMLRDRLQEYGGIVGGLRDQIADPREVVYRPMEAALVPAPWHHGRVILIGDAAHSGTPHLAEGAAMAIEDAVVLADMLSERGSLEETLQKFTARRLPRCKLVYEAGLQLGAWELREWTGDPDPATDHAGLMHSALETLMEPI